LIAFSAENKRIKFMDIRQRVMLEKAGKREGITLLPDPVGDKTRCFEGDVLQTMITHKIGFNIRRPAGYPLRMARFARQMAGRL